MNRPMPGPPECECREVPEQFWTTHYGAVDPVTQIEYTPECPLHGEVSSSKHLSDAECAAEYWREQAEWWAGTHTKGPTAEDVDIRRAATWERFATHPHAFKETRA